jgi:hypothetical protein
MGVLTLYEVLSELNHEQAKKPPREAHGESICAAAVLKKVHDAGSKLRELLYEKVNARPLPHGLGLKEWAARPTRAGGAIPAG